MDILVQFRLTKLLGGVGWYVARFTAFNHEMME